MKQRLVQSGTMPGIQLLQRVGKSSFYHSETGKKLAEIVSKTTWDTLSDPLTLPTRKLDRVSKSSNIEGFFGNESLRHTFQFEQKEKYILVSPKIFAELHPNFKPLITVPHFLTSFQLQEKVMNIALPKIPHPLPTPGKVGTIFLDGRVQQVSVLGFDYRERPIVHTQDDPLKITRIITSAKQALLLLPGPGEYQAFATTLNRGKVFKPTEEFCQLMEYALTREIVGPKTGMDYIEWLHKNGHETFVLGGAIRDISREFLIQVLANEDAVKLVNDIDVSCIAGPPTALRMFKEIHGSTTDLYVEGFPEVGSIHGHIEGGSGFDWNATMIGNYTYDLPRIHPDIAGEGPLPPSRFGGVSDRCFEAIDFCCNTLMYDPINRLIIDPTGYGLEDAIHGFLRLTEGDKLLHSPKETLPYKQVELLQRFWKFRFRNMKSNAYTTLLFQLAAANRWNEEGLIVFYNDIMKMLPIKKLNQSSKSLATKELHQMLDRLEEVMREDDLVVEQKNMLFKKFIKPHRENIVDFIINRKKP